MTQPKYVVRIRGGDRQLWNEIIIAARRLGIKGYELANQAFKEKLEKLKGGDHAKY